jgi:hypothetical protein
MSLAVVVDTLAGRLQTATGASASDVRPADAAAVPHVTITLDDATRSMAGIGEIPRSTRSGSLPVTSEIDLGNPTLEFGNETVQLVSPDRLTFIIPHGPVVRPEEVTVSDDDGAYAVVDVAPAGRQVRVDVDLGELVFGQALPGNGTLRADFFIGRWDVTSVRYGGDLILDVIDSAPAAVAALSRAVADELDRPGPAFDRLNATAWGAVTAVTVGADAAHSQVLRYRFEFELEQPSLPTGGGVLRTVAVTSDTDGTTEQYEVTHEGSDA